MPENSNSRNGSNASDHASAHSDERTPDAHDTGAAEMPPENEDTEIFYEAAQDAAAHAATREVTIDGETVSIFVAIREKFESFVKAGMTYEEASAQRQELIGRFADPFESNEAKINHVLLSAIKQFCDLLSEARTTHKEPADILAQQKDRAERQEESAAANEEDRFKPEWNQRPTHAQRTAFGGCFRIYTESVTWISGDKPLPPGTYWHSYIEAKDGKPGKRIDLCLSTTPFRVVCEALNYDETFNGKDTRRGNSRFIEYFDVGEQRWHDVFFPTNKAARSQDLEAWFLERGIALCTTEEGTTKKIKKYIVHVPSEKEKKFYTLRTGWHCNENLPPEERDAQLTYVLPDFRIGPLPIRFNSDGETARYGTGGTFEGWYRNVAALACGNYLMTLALNVALSGTILRFLKLPGLMNDIFGNTSIGKTTLLTFAASVYGHGKRFTASCRMTDNAIEAIAAQHSDACLFMDETGQMKPEHLSEITYMLVSGEGKKRMRQDASMKRTYIWTAACISTGEKPVADRMAEGNIEINSGQELRAIEIEAGQAAYGVFDDLHDCATSADFAARLEAAACTDYGHACERFVAQVAATNKAWIVSLYERMLAAFISKDGGLDGLASNGQEKRAPKTFAAAATAGALAHEWGIVPYAVDESLAHALRAFGEWKASRQSSSGEQGRAETARLAQRISNGITQFRESRFSSLKARSSPDESDPGDSRDSQTEKTGIASGKKVRPFILNRLGYWERLPMCIDHMVKMVKGKKEEFRQYHDTKKTIVYYMTSSGLLELAKPYGIRSIIAALNELGAIYEHDKGKNQITKWIPETGVPEKFYAIDFVRLNPGTEDFDEAGGF